MLGKDCDLETEVGLGWLNQEKFNRLINKYKLKEYEKPVCLGSLDVVAYFNKENRVYFFEKRLVKTRKKDEIPEYKPRFSLDL